MACKQGHFVAYHSAKIRAPVCNGIRKRSARFVKRPGKSNYYLNSSQLTKYGVARGRKKSQWEKQKEKKVARRAKYAQRTVKLSKTKMKKKDKRPKKPRPKKPQKLPSDVMELTKKFAGFDKKKWLHKNLRSLVFDYNDLRDTLGKVRGGYFKSSAYKEEVRKLTPKKALENVKAKWAEIVAMWQRVNKKKPTHKDIEKLYYHSSNSNLNEIKPIRTQHHPTDPFLEKGRRADRKKKAAEEAWKKKYADFRKLGMDPTNARLAAGPKPGNFNHQR